MDEQSQNPSPLIPWKSAVVVTVIGLFLLGVISWVVRNPREQREVNTGKPIPTSPPLQENVTKEEEGTVIRGGSDTRGVTLTRITLTKDVKGNELLSFTFAHTAPDDAAQAPLLSPPRFTIRHINEELSILFEAVETIAVADLDAVAKQSSLITNVASSLAIDDERLTWKLALAKNVGIRIHAQGPTLELTLRGSNDGELTPSL